MYETEVSQVVLQSANMELRQMANEVNYSNKSSFSAEEKERARAALLSESISKALRQRIARA